jgi:hypothetical protein
MENVDSWGTLRDVRAFASQLLPGLRIEAGRTPYDLGLTGLVVNSRPAANSSAPGGPPTT